MADDLTANERKRRERERARESVRGRIQELVQPSTWAELEPALASLGFACLAQLWEGLLESKSRADG